jgi:putative phosphoesterase
LVIHTGDITRVNTLDRFKNLNCKLIGVFGNEDKERLELSQKAEELGFDFSAPPLRLSIKSRKILVLHDPIHMEKYDLSCVDLVLHGHTHRQRTEWILGTLIFNPGECAGFLTGYNSIGIVNLADLEPMLKYF